jgi:hypothetical protein
MQKLSKEDLEKQIIIDEYEFNSSQRIQQEEENIKKALEALQPVINQNLRYLQYAQAKGFFTMNSKEEEINTATHNTVVNIANRAFKWEPNDAVKMCFEILQDVNLHEEAAQVAKVLEINLKPYEVE